MVAHSRRSINWLAPLACLATSVVCSCTMIFADEYTSPATQSLLNQIQQKRTERQTAEKQVALKQAALDVTRKRMSELQKLIDDAALRARTEEAELLSIREASETLNAEISLIAKDVELHQQADELQRTADASQARLEQLVSARRNLEAQLSDLRKAAVEWQSKTTEAEQQIKALESQRAELQKAVDAAKTPNAAAQQALTAANQALKTSEDQLLSVKKSLADEQQRLDSSAVASEKLTESIVALRKSLDELRESAKSMGVSPDEAVNGLSAAINELQPLQKNAEMLVSQATERRDSMNRQLAMVQANYETKKAEQLAAATAAEKTADGLMQASDKITALDKQQADFRTASSNAQSHQKLVAGQIAALNPSIQKLSAEVQMLTDETVRQQRLAQAAMTPLGRFVSFANDIAPILAKRCVACHNTRSPGGRLNLDSYAAVLKGGESGAAFEAHNSLDSLLVMMIEDGSMPKDADPLTEDEIAAIKRWVDVGAPLDAGLLASAELFDVMPEVSQPLPPESYRVPIPITATAFSPDGSTLATSGYHEVLIWKTDGGELVRRISNVAERVYDLEFSQDGSQLAVAAGTPGQLGEVKLFAAADGTLQSTVVRAKDSVFAVSYSPDGTQLACAGADRTVVVVQVSDGAVITKVEDHADWVMDVNWSPDGNKLVSSSRDKTCKVFDAKSGDPLVTFSGHGESVYTAAFLSDSQTVVSGGGDKRIRVWNTADAKEIRSITGFGSEIFRVVVIARDHVLSACADRNVREHNAVDGKVVRTMSGHSDWVYTLTINPVRKLIASGSYDGEVRVWNAEDGKMTASFIAIPAAGDSSTVADLR